MGVRGGIASKDLTDQQIEKLLEVKRKWIYKNLAEWRDLNATKVQREYVNGEGFLYLGRTYRLKLVQEQSIPVMLKDGYFCLRTNGLSPDAAFKEFYKEKGKQRLKKRVVYYQAKLAVEPKAIRILDL